MGGFIVDHHRTARSSPRQLEFVSVLYFRSVFLSSSGAYQTLLPAEISPMSLMERAPTYVDCCSVPDHVRQLHRLRAGLWHVAFGWANIGSMIWGHPSLAIVRSKVVFWLLFLASWFLSFLVGVSESPSMFSRADGFHFSFRWSIMACAALQHC